MAYTKRDTYTYDLYKGNKKVYTGITNNPDRRLKEHARDKDFDTMRYDTYPTSRSTARQREASRLAAYRKGLSEKNSK